MLILKKKLELKNNPKIRFITINNEKEDHGLISSIYNIYNTIDIDELILHNMSETCYRERQIKLVASTYMNKRKVPQDFIYVRKLMKKMDLVDGNNNKFEDNSPHITIDRYGGNFPKEIYHINKEDIALKSMIITGISIYDNYRFPIDEVQIWKTGRKLLDRHVLSGSYINEYRFISPILIGLTDDDHDLTIRVSLKKEVDSNQYLPINDNNTISCNLGLIGYVAEPIGLNIG